MFLENWRRTSVWMAPVSFPAPFKFHCTEDLLLAWYVQNVMFSFCFVGFPGEDVCKNSTAASLLATAQKSMPVHGRQTMPVLGAEGGSFFGISRVATCTVDRGKLFFPLQIENEEWSPVQLVLEGSRLTLQYFYLFFHHSLRNSLKAS